METNARFLASLGSGVLLSLSAAAQGVVVVSAGAFVQPIVDAAPPGTILLFESGSYGDLVLRRDIALVADVTAQVVLQRVVVRDLPAGERVLLQGLTGFPPTFNGVQGGIALIDCDGTVALEACAFFGPIDNPFGPFECVDILGCASVSIRDCTLAGGAESTFGTVGPGIRARNSRVHVFGSTVRGAAGLEGAALDGGAAVVLESSTLFAQDSTIRGGAGGFQFQPFSCGPAGSGGPGLERSGTGAIWLRNTLLEGGPAGVPDCVGGTIGSTGPSYVGDPSALRVQAAAPAGLGFQPDPVRAGSTSTMSMSGPPGHVAYILSSLRPATLLLQSRFSLLGLGAPISILGSMTLDATGSAQLTRTANLPTGILGRTFEVQLLLLDPMHPNAWTLGAPTTLLVLDSSF